MKKNMHGRIASAVSAAALAVTALGAMPAAMPASAAGLTGQDAKGITSQMVIGWNLGNSLDSHGSSLKIDASPDKFAKAWGNPAPTEELFQTVKDGGFNTVRIPTTWYEHLQWDESSQMYLITDSWMDYVKQTVDYAYDRDMFIILNMHHENFINEKVWSEDTYQVAAKKLGDIWTQVAEEFKDYDQHLIFEGMNEPRQTGNPAVSEWGYGNEEGGYSQQYINKLNAIFVDKVRGQGSDANKERLLMLPSYCATSTPAGIRSIEIPANAGNVALSVHAYAPYFFTMATDKYANHEFPGKSGYGEDYEGALANMFNEFNQIQNEKGAPIIIGEFSASDFGNTEDRARWATSYLSKAKDAGIPCVLWDNNVIGRTDGEAHGYVYRATNTWYSESIPVVEAMMKVYGVTPKLPPYQAYVRPAFSWDKVTIGEDWIEVYRNDKGLELEAWDPSGVTGWKDYANENYDWVLFYDSEGDPALVLQGDGKEGSWNYVDPSDTDTMFTAKFTYDNFAGSLSGETVAEMANLYISAKMSDIVAYGLYAVPKGGGTTPTEPQPTKAVKGDINNDSSIDVVDLVLMKRIILGQMTPPDPKAVDVNESQTIGIDDYVLLYEYVHGMITEFPLMRPPV